MKGLIATAEEASALHDGTQTIISRPMKPQPISVERCRELTGAAYSLFQDDSQPGKWRIAGPCGVVLKESGIATNGMYSWTPPYAVGDDIFVKETLYTTEEEAVFYRADNTIHYPETHDERVWIWKQCVNTTIPSTRMPQILARTFLKIKSVKAMQVQDISPIEAAEHGITRKETVICDATVWKYQAIWDARYAKKGLGWDVNPWIFSWEVEKINP